MVLIVDRLHFDQTTATTKRHRQMCHHGQMWPHETNIVPRHPSHALSTIYHTTLSYTVCRTLAPELRDHVTAHNFCILAPATWPTHSTHQFRIRCDKPDQTTVFELLYWFSGYPGVCESRRGGAVRLSTFGAVHKNRDRLSQNIHLDR